MKEIRCSVFGRVQMVMFRDFVQRKASKLGLTGFVQNMSDGTVQVIAQGDEQKLNELLQLLNKGPVLARVDRVDVSWQEPQDIYNSFVIEYS